MSRVFDGIGLLGIAQRVTLAVNAAHYIRRLIPRDEVVNVKVTVTVPQM